MSNSLSAQLITNATVAQYIHEISARHRPRGPETPQPTDRRSAAASSSRRKPLLEGGLRLVPSG